MEKKIAPWLEGLSEGWEVPDGQHLEPTVSSASHDANSLRQGTSRLPRRSLSGLSSSLHQHSRSQNSVRKQRSPLEPISHNDINTTRRRSPPAQLQSSRSFSGASKTSSFVGTVQQRPKSASPKKKEPMEWEKRLLSNAPAYGEQTELFGPSGLENIFAKNRDTENERPTPANRGAWRQETSDVLMPSSPPSWPLQSEDRQQSRTGAVVLESVSEESGLAFSGSQGSLESNPFDLSCSKLSSSVQKPRPDSIVIERSLSGVEARTHPTPNHEESRTFSGQTVLDQEGFSPVFVSKRTSETGSIKYAPMDSRQMMESQQHEDRAPAPPKDADVPVSSKEATADTERADVANIMEESFGDSAAPGADFSFSENLPTGSPLPSLGGHVEFKRGGYSRYGSFQHRLLSPSQTTSAEDELQQTHGPVTSLQASAHQSGRQQIRRDTPNSPGPHNRSPSHSPLKLFGPHDTFTSNKLLRRLSQINPEGTLANRPRTPSSKSFRAISLSRLPAAAARNASRQTSFGSGELDGHSFHAEITITSPTASVTHHSDRSPGSEIEVPGSKIPMGFRPPSFTGGYRMSSRGPPSQARESETPGDLDDEERETHEFSDLASVEEPSQAIIDNTGDEPIYVQGKRPPTSPVKHPTPKRRRTLHASEIEVSVSATSSSLRMKLQDSINSRKRKDARPGGPINVADPEVLAQRKILRPRNSTPNDVQKQKVRAEVYEATEEFATQQPEMLEAVLEQIESSMSSDSMPSLRQQAETLASEVAAFTLNVRKPSGVSGERKRSVTTQDFLNEAMMVMKVIRARARPQSNLGSVDEFGGDHARQESRIDESETEKSPLRVSRPPSREGSGWRPRNRGHAPDPRVVSHLRKFQEKGTDDTDFIAASIASLQVDTEDAGVDEPVVIMDEEANIRITAPPRQSTSRPEEDDSRPLSQRSQQSTLQTQSTQMSSGTTGQTVGTNSTRKSENVGTLAPDAVAHLIGEQVGGMTFDRERQRWVRLSKSPGKRKDTSFLELPSTATSDEDPFQEISDLPVDEQMELRRISSPGKVTQAQAVAALGKGPASSIRDHAVASQEDEPVKEIRTGSTETVISRPVTRDGNPPIQHLPSSSVPSRYSGFASSQHDKIETRATSWNDEELARMATWRKTAQQSLNSTMLDGFFTQKAVPIIEPVLEAEEESEISISEVNSNQEESAVEHSVLRRAQKDGYLMKLVDDTTLEHSHDDLASLDSPKLRQTPCKATTLPNHVLRPGARQVSLRRQTLHNRFAADTREVSELSIIAPLPGDRMVSLSLSVTRPKASRHPIRSITTIQSSPSKQESSLLFSDLPEFTLHGDDVQRSSEQALAMRLARHAADEVNDQYALSVKELVKTLADVKEDEPFWEDVKALDLHNRSLTTVFGLEDFCTRMQELDISGNSLVHLQGAPGCLRTLVARNNLLNGLTPWGHLMNLQYLDVSGNQLESLDGLAGLIHLRELRADDNLVCDLNGVFELDGLLKLRLRRNKLRDVDFAGCFLQRLTELDLVDNEISSLESVEQLRALTCLRLDRNKLEHGLVLQKSMPSMTDLSMCGCDMDVLDVSAFPNLTYLVVDDNHLADINGLSHLNVLQTLSMRRQTIPEGSQISIFEHILEARTVHLSENDLRSLPFPQSYPNIQHLELASASLDSLPADFGLRFSNLRTLNVNFNALDDLRPFLNIPHLGSLSICSNRIGRMRKSVAALAKMRHLTTVDLRDNPLTQRFHAPLAPNVPKQECLVAKSDNAHGDDEDAKAAQAEQARYSLCPGSVNDDQLHYSRLDEDTKLRRRVLEMLLANDCPSLSVVDGLPFDRACSLARDEVWERLLELGILRRTD